MYFEQLSYGIMQKSTSLKTSRFNIIIIFKLQCNGYKIKYYSCYIAWQCSQCKTVIQYLLFLFSDDGHNKPRPRNGALPEPNEYKCLVRASLGNRKISTVVRFVNAWTHVCMCVRVCVYVWVSESVHIYSTNRQS